MRQRQDDYVHVVKVETWTDATKTATLAAGFEIPTGMTFPVGSRVGRLKKVVVGQTVTQPDLACKVTGILPKDNTPFTILLPKVKVT
ncbi:hypothetical protein, partial [Mesorhizobium sp. M2E.F.Ca.ET.154.01.1.1]|uniref:hypothetical protein n=1 Tax=Mesorhizobium sp. M2E.F.Ca.ET.154.01.1.1 TaxID=2500521 RepID=UPI001092B0CA